MKNACLSLLLFLCYGHLYCQNHTLGGLQIINADYNLSNKWYVWAEAQIRSQKVGTDYNYNEIKTGVTYKASKLFSFLVGAGKYATYSSGGNFKKPVLTNELRMWGQANLKNSIARLRIDNQVRFEERLINDNFKSRLRYRLNLIYLINKPKLEQGTFYGTAYNEIFVSTKPLTFDRDRIFAGAGYIFHSAFGLQIGWLRQYDYFTDKPKNRKDYIQTTLSFHIKHISGSSIRHPGILG